jgi:hypothetical protein
MHPSYRRRRSKTRGGTHRRARDPNARTLARKNPRALVARLKAAKRDAVRDDDDDARPGGVLPNPDLQTPNDEMWSAGESDGDDEEDGAVRRRRG